MREVCMCVLAGNILVCEVLKHQIFSQQKKNLVVKPGDHVLKVNGESCAGYVYCNTLQHTTARCKNTAES